MYTSDFHSRLEVILLGKTEIIKSNDKSCWTSCLLILDETLKCFFRICFEDNVAQSDHSERNIRARLHRVSASINLNLNKPSESLQNGFAILFDQIWCKWWCRCSKSIIDAQCKQALKCFILFRFEENRTENWKWPQWKKHKTLSIFLVWIWVLIHLDSRKYSKQVTYSLSLRTTYVTWHLTILRIWTMVLTSLMPLITHGIKACYDRHTLSVQPECPARLQSKHMTPCQAYNRDSSLCTTGHCFIASFFARHVLRTVHTELKWRHSFFFNFGGHQFFLWGHWYPFLDFWWHLPEFQSQCWILSLAYFIACMQWNPQIHLWGDSCWPLGGQDGNRAVLDILIWPIRSFLSMVNRSNGFYFMDWNSLRSCQHLEIACFFS